ncbi:MAG: DUF6365 family protein [Cyanobacteriota bacterium]
MKILFLILGAVSFKSINFLRAFVRQIDLDLYKITVLSEELNKEYLEAEKKIKSITINEDFDAEYFQSFLEENYDLVIIVNSELVLFDEKSSFFKKAHFSLLEDHDVLFFNSTDQMTFKKSSIYFEENPKNKIKLNFPFGIIKPCPPYLPGINSSDTDVQVFYWNALETFAFLKRDEAKTSLKERLKSKKETKLVSIIIDLEHFLAASYQKISYHYKVLIECVAYYLSKLDIECDLVIGNIPKINLDDSYEKVKISFLGPLTESENETLVRASDLIITESIANPILIDASNLKIPVITMKNTLLTEIKFDEEGEYTNIVHNFSELTPFIQSKVEELINNCPDSIFNYFAFPNKATLVFNQLKIFGLYIFNFCELFYEKQVLDTMNSLLINEETRKAEIYRIEQYLALRSESLDAQEIINSIFNNSDEDV